MTDPVITVTPTMQDGTVVRWHRDVPAAQLHQVTISASRNGVLTGPGVYLTDIPDEWVTAAREAHTLLAANSRADVSGYATHRHRMFSNGPLEPIEKGVS